MNFEYLEEILNNVVTDKRLGICKDCSPFLLNPEEFIDLLNSHISYDYELNKLIGKGNKRYYHTVKYKGEEFLTHTKIKITEMNYQ